ncbi:MAG TPA: dUTP diphosphatase [Rhabdochlamydiaceae bacterium]|nr:dUTP diphosphatase [Rhabdochlamydiaceae bacterium]
MQKKEVFITLKDPSFLPTYGSELASGADVRAYIEQDVLLAPGATLLVPTGIFFAIPEGYEIQVRPRSGLALKHGITILNTPGTIDADYRGELGLILINHGKNTFTISRGMRLAQIVLAPVMQAEFLIVDSLEATTRGEGGFGHTGTH